MLLESRFGPFHYCVTAFFVKFENRSKQVVLQLLSLIFAGFFIFPHILTCSKRQINYFQNGAKVYPARRATQRPAHAGRPPFRPFPYPCFRHIKIHQNLDPLDSESFRHIQNHDPLIGFWIIWTSSRRLQNHLKSCPPVYLKLNII